MENKIKISIIIPIFNCESFLDRCLKSVVNQTLKEIEIICVDDGSTDNSVSIIEKYAKEDNRAQLIREKNMGISTARNTGLLNATGEFIAFVDSDDFIDNDFCEKLYNAAVKNGAEIACAGIIRENNKKKKTLVSFEKEICTDDIRQKFLLTHAPKHCFVWNKIYKREAMANCDLHFPDGLVYEDMVFTPKAFECLKRLVTVPNTHYHYWKHPNSLIKADCDKFRADKIMSRSYLAKKAQEYNLEYDKKWELVKKYDYSFFGLKILKVYEYRATKKYYLFGIIPFFVKKEYI